MKRRTTFNTLAGTGIGLLARGSPAAYAQGAAGGTVVASGLTNPRFVAVGGDGTLYVSEAGSGGSEAVPPPPGAPPGGPPTTRGTTGQITRIAPGGAKSVLVGGLPSYLGGFGGPAGLALAGGALWLAVGGPGPVTATATPLGNEGALLRINPQTGAVTKVADVMANEKASNPDGFLVESNLYGLALGADGQVYVADAGGNTLYRANPNTGQLALVTVFPGLPAADPNPRRGDAMEVDAVPTGVAASPDGGLYVALHRGGMPVEGGTKVVRVALDGRITDFATGLTFLGGAAVGPDRQLYVAEITTGLEITPQGPMPKPGRVLRVLGGTRTQVVAEGLPFPNGIAFDAAGNMYVVTGTTAFGPPPAEPPGQVLRFDRVAAPAVGLPRTGAGAGIGLSGLAGIGAMAGALGAAGVGAVLLRRRRLG